MDDNLISQLPLNQRIPYTVFHYLFEKPIILFGLESWSKRFIVISLVSYLALRLFQPKGLFKSNGDARPSYLFVKDISAVPLNVYMISAIIGLVSVLFI